MPQVIYSLAKQRRFKILFISIIVSSLALGFLVVPVEISHPESTINNFFDGLWWSIQTITSVGYGDIVPVTWLGKLIGMFLQLMGVFAFGLMTGMVTIALFEHRDNYYRRKMFERLDELENTLQRVEKQSAFGLGKEIEEMKKKQKRKEKKK